MAHAQSPPYKSIRRYTGMAELSEREYRRLFPKVGQPWRTDDLQYLCEWWGRDDALSLAYALGRPPWSLQRTVSRLRREGADVPYIRG